MWVKHLSSLQFLTYVAFFAVVVAAICRFVPGKAAPVRETPYPEDELYAHDRKTAKYFVAGGLFLVLGSVHAAVKNLPWLAEYLARTGYAGHLVRDLSNTHLTIVGGGTLLATGLCWLALPRIVGRPLASEGLAQCAFWFTAMGLAIFYVSLVANGIAMGSLIEHGWTYEAAKAHMGNWYKAPTGMGAGVMGLGYWCFATNVFITVFQARTVHVPKPQWHLWKFFATGAAALTVGTVQGVIQVAPGNADWLYRAGHAGEWIDPISHAHINLVTGLAMLVFGALFVRTQPSRRLVDALRLPPGVRSKAPRGRNRPHDVRRDGEKREDASLSNGRHRGKHERSLGVLANGQRQPAGGDPAGVGGPRRDRTGSARDSIPSDLQRLAKADVEHDDEPLLRDFQLLHGPMLVRRECIHAGRLA